MAPFPGWAPLIVCDGVVPNDANLPQCSIGSAIQLVKNGLQDLVLLSTLLMVVVLVIAGIKLLTSQGNPSALKETKDAFMKILTGYAVILAAWVIVYTLASTLLKPEFYYFLGK